MYIYIYIYTHVYIYIYITVEENLRQTSSARQVVPPETRLAQNSLNHLNIY